MGPFHMRVLPLDDPAAPSPQLVVTIGPASGALVPEMAAAGATAFRLNASHLSPASLARALGDAARACPRTPLVVDLQGAKIRLGRFEPRALAEGELVRFALHAGGGIPLPHAELFAQVRPGNTLSVDDGRVRLRIREVRDDGLTADALDAGVLQPRKGVNVEPHPVTLHHLTQADRDACEVAARCGVRAFAFSFMSTGAEAEWLRREVPGCAVIGKIERAEAAGRLDEIARVVDAVWICRGDLGAQLGPARLARFVAAVAPARLGPPVLMAGQVLEHLTGHPEPTRSEVCHLHDLLERGYAGIVLSDETAIGADPVRAVRTAATLLRMLR